MGYELTIALRGGAIEIEADTQEQLEKRLAALDLPRLERAIRDARGAKPDARAAAPKARTAKRPARGRAG